MSALLRADWYSMGISSTWAVGVGAGTCVGVGVGAGGWVSFSSAGIAEGFKGAAVETLAGEAAEGEGVVSAGEDVVSAGRRFSSCVSDKAFGTLASLEEKSP